MATPSSTLSLDLVEQMFPPPPTPPLADSAMGAYLREFVRAHGKTMHDLASVSGVSTTALSSYKKGLKQPRLSILQRLAQGMAAMDGKSSNGSYTQHTYHRLAALAQSGTTKGSQTVPESLQHHPLFQTLIARLETMDAAQREALLRLALGSADVLAPQQV